MQVYAAPYDYAGTAFYDSAWDDDALASARVYVDAVAVRLRALGLSVDAEARMARGVTKAIVETAEQASVDLIVMSTQALTVRGSGWRKGCCPDEAAYKERERPRL